MLSAQVIRPDALTPPDLEAWTKWRAAHPVFANPLFGPKWAQAVGRFRPDAAVAVLKRQGRTIGFLPHQRRRGGQARPIGAPFSDLHALSAEPGAALTLEEAVRAAGLPSFAFTGLVDPDNRAGDACEQLSAHVIEHRPGDDVLELVRSRNAKRFKNWRRLGHKLEREQGLVELSAPDQDPVSLASLLTWKSTQLRGNGLHDVFRPAWVRALMRDLFTTNDPVFGGLQVTLRTAGRAVAGEFGVREGAAYHPWIAGFDPQYAAYSPGIILQLRLIERMEPLGLTRYDLGHASDYKTPLTTGELVIKAGAARSRGGGSPLRAALDRSSTGARIVRRWDQIGAVETTGLGRAHALLDALRDAPRRLGGASRTDAEA
jgi:CelD/BcsL family acetyltransferase involved in cellulose biosynthesis